MGKASDHLPALVILSYLPSSSSSSAPSVCMVGKGIVYDTGGLSVKVPPNMAGMKRDMGGSAAVLGAFDALVRSNQCTAPLHALLCIAENSISNEATRPDDIHTLYSGGHLLPSYARPFLTVCVCGSIGKTVEINNTDAEGRLVLSDGCAYAARHLRPAVILDMATLTGAQLIATGTRFGALYCNNDELEDLGRRAGVYSGG